MTSQRSEGFDGSEAGGSRMCTEVQRHLPVHVRGELGAVRRRLVTLHTRGCGDCRTALELSLIHISEPTRPY